jgi:hypothetical protein
MKSSKHSTQVMIFIILVVIFFGGLSAASLRLFAQSVIPSNPIEDAVTSSKKLLEYATNYPTEEMPRNDIPSYLWVTDDCWELLQRTITENGKSYRVTAYKNGPDFRDVNDIISQIDFSTGRRILIGYYEGGLTWCREPKIK